MTSVDLRDQVAIDVQAMRRQLIEIGHLLSGVGDREPTSIEKAAAGAFLGQIYGGLENILKRFCRYSGVPLPVGPQWHRDLLDLFDEGCSPSLPRLFDSESSAILDEYRRFRHLFVHGYAVTLDWPRLRPLLEEAPSTFETFFLAVEEALKGQF